MAWYQEWFGEEYLELYSHRDEHEAREQVAFFKQQCGALDGPVLDLACGTGDIAFQVATEGREVVGLDLTLRML